MNVVYASRPAFAEVLERAEALEKLEACRAAGLDQRCRVGDLRGRSHQRLRHAAVGGKRGKRALQPFHGLADAAVHAAVEDDIVETGRQIVAENGIPILRFVDVVALGGRHQVNVLKRLALAFAVSVVVGVGNTPVRAAARIVRVVRFATLVHEHKRERLREVCGRHCSTPTLLTALIPQDEAGLG